MTMNSSLFVAATLLLLVTFQLNINGIRTEESQYESTTTMEFGTKTTYGDYQPVNERTFDLSYPYHNSTPHWPNAMGFKFVKRIVQNDYASSWYAANDFCVGEHGGTHLDAPYHFNQNGWKVADIPMEKLINRAFVLDVETYNDNEHSSVNTTLEPLHIQQFEKKLFGDQGKLPENSILLVRFNWGQYYGTDKYYNLIPATEEHSDQLSFPGISPDAARLLVARNIAGVGVDAASVDAGNSVTFESHRIFAKANIFLMENVNMPQEMLEFNDNLIVYALPMNILEGTGAPVRAVAVVPKKSESNVVPKIFGRTQIQKRNVPPTFQNEKPVNHSSAWYAQVWVIFISLFLLGMHAMDILSLK